MTPKEKFNLWVKKRLGEDQNLEVKDDRYFVNPTTQLVFDTYLAGVKAAREYDLKDLYEQ